MRPFPSALRAPGRRQLNVMAVSAELVTPGEAARRRAVRASYIPGLMDRIREVNNAAALPSSSLIPFTVDHVVLGHLRPRQGRQQSGGLGPRQAGMAR